MKIQKSNFLKILLPTHLLSLGIQYCITIHLIVTEVNDIFISCKLKVFAFEVYSYKYLES